MLNHYHHTQVGFFTIIALAVAWVFSALLMANLGLYWPVLVAMIIFSICLVLFATLTVDIKERVLEIRFGPGIIRKTFSLKEIEFCQVVKNPWYYGWGIRRTPHGWLYNISGLHAVEITLKNGKKYRIGTDEPNALAQAIQNVIGKA
ncbi:MAG: hypothetical protein ONB16_11260 [candidate division KSB1 bacterium]|nr:hypothetical protein [candidate division KSB1 bacterium]MDZ7339707.1 hypothetical protein [candidate division KSB1 bacterium]